MDVEFIKSNYFDLLLTITLTTAGLCRLFSPELRQKEINNLSITEIHESILILFELSAAYIIFFTNNDIKKIYYSIYIIACFLIILFYLSQKSLSNILLELKELCIFQNDMKSIWYHLVYIFILIYIIIK